MKRITESELRRIIREAFLNEVRGRDGTDLGGGFTDPAAVQPTAELKDAQQLPPIPKIEHTPETQEHAELEKKSLGDTGNLMQKEDAYYTDFIKKFPDTAKGLADVFNCFEIARQNRINYLRGDFKKRYADLKQHLGIMPSTAPESVQQAMIDRVASCVLWLGRYGDDVESFGRTKAGDSPEAIAILARDDPSSGWTKNLVELGITKNAYGGAYAYAPVGTNVVVSTPPPLVYSGEWGIFGAIALEELIKIYEHELIHQEDSAQFKDEPHHTQLAAYLAARLVQSAALPAGSLTGENILARIKSSPTMKDLILSSVNWMMEDNDFMKQKYAEDAVIVMEIAAFAKNMSPGYFSDHNTYISFLQGRFPEDTDIRLNPLYALLSNSTKMQSHMRDIAGDSHIRIALTQMLPHLDTALGEIGANNTAGVIEHTLSAMQKVAGADAYRAAHILAITDPTKLSDLTRVASREQNTGSSSGAVALAEQFFCRWAQLTGL